MLIVTANWIFYNKLNLEELFALPGIFTNASQLIRAACSFPKSNIFMPVHVNTQTRTIIIIHI
jgi:hypothetical protein